MTYEYGPSENAIVINTMSQLSRSVSTKFDTSAVLAPTRREEKIRGYDVDVRDLLGLVLQFKRPSVVKAMRRPSKISKPAARFHVDTDQLLTLRSGFGVKEAFFVLSPLHDSDSLHEALERSVFVDVYGLPANTSLLYTPCDCCTSGETPVVEGLIRNGTKFSIPNWYVHCFDDFKSRLDAHGVGIKLIEDGYPGSGAKWLDNRLSTLCNSDVDELIDALKRNTSNWAETFSEQEAAFYGIDSESPGDEYLAAKRFMDSSFDDVADDVKELVTDLNRERDEMSESSSDFDPLNFVLRRSEANYCLLGESGEE